MDAMDMIEVCDKKEAQGAADTTDDETADGAVAHPGSAPATDFTQRPLLGDNSCNAGDELKDAKIVPDREKWSGKLDFLLSVVGLCIGIGNVWRFPYLCYSNGGGVFLIPYFLTLILAGMPMLLLELSVGQMFSIGGLGIWKVCPLFKGVGYAATIMAFWLSIYYVVILAYALYYLCHAFTLGPLPWSECENKWNTECCRSGYDQNASYSCVQRNISLLSGNFSMRRVPNFLDLNNTGYVSQTALSSWPNETALCLNCSSWLTPEMEFWERNVLEVSEGIHAPGQIRWPLALTLLVSWVICYFCIWRGVKWTGKVVYFTAVFPYILLFVLFIRGVMLPGSAKGIEFYLKPNITKLAESQVWMSAASQIFFSYGLGLGTHVALGSYNSFRNNCHRDALLVACVNSATSFFAGFVVFSVTGYMAQKQNTSVEKVARAEQGLAFLVYPSAISQMQGSHVWAVLFFLMLFFVGIDSQFCTIEGFVTAIMDEWPDKFRGRRELFLAVVCIVSYFIGLSMITQGGAYVFRLFDHFSASGMALLSLIFFECIAFSWSFGVKRFAEKLSAMLGFKLNVWWTICWVFLCPGLVFSVFLFSVIRYKPLTYKDTYNYPSWALALGWMMAASSIFAIPIHMVCYIVRHVFLNKQGTLSERMKQAFRPEIEVAFPTNGEEATHV